MARPLKLAVLALAGAGLAAAQEAAEKPEPSEAWLWINFVLLALGLGYLAMKFLPSYFRSRSEEIQKGIADAQEQKRSAEARAAEVGARVSSLAADIEKLRTESQALMKSEGERIREATAAEIARLTQQGEMEIESALKTAQRELREFAAKLALDLAAERVRGRLDSETEAGLVDGFVSDLSVREASKN